MSNQISKSRAARRDLLAAVLYPDAADSTDSVQLQYNLQSEVNQMQDQNGNVHQYFRDLLSRQISDQVTTLGANVDGTVLRIDTAYEIRGMVSQVTSYPSPSGGSVVNEVVLAYNPFEQLYTETQYPRGVGGGAPSYAVTYAYANGSANT